MKNTKLLFTLFICFFSTTLFAQTQNRYEKALQTSLTEINTAESLHELQQVANKLERISQAEAGEWLPAYYLGYIYLQMATKSNQKEAARYLDLSQQQLDRLQEIAPENSEVLTLQGYKHMLYVAADPANRGADYTPRTMEAFQRAIALDPNNPRAYLLMGQMQFGVAKFFGSSTKEACGLIQRASQLINQESEDMLLPRWGKETAAAGSRMCEAAQAKKE
jgi:cytochrome c-type biogenesis protein CcmH/NrfG